MSHNDPVSNDPVGSQGPPLGPTVGLSRTVIDLLILVCICVIFAFPNEPVTHPRTRGLVKLPYATKADGATDPRQPSQHNFLQNYQKRLCLK